MNVKRVETEEEAESLLPLGRAMYDESRFGVLRYDPVVVQALALGALRDNSDSVLFGYWDKTETPSGAFLGYVAPMWFGPDLMACDYALYLRPGSRNTREGTLAACRMIEMFEAWAKERGALQVTVGVSAGIRDESAVRLYKRFGYAPAGVMLQKKI